MKNLSFNDLTTDARSLADRLGAQTTEALIRAAAGIQQTANEGVTTAREGTQSAIGMISPIQQGVTEGVQTLALPTTSARMAWRAGRFVGRLEGAVRLAAFGVRIWWRRRQRSKQGQTGIDWTRSMVQWGPSAVASVYLVTQVVMRLRRRGAAT